MKTIVLITLCFLFRLNFLAQSPPWHWTVKTNPCDTIAGINSCTDKYGNIFVSLGGNANSFVSEVEYGTHLAKYHSNGTLIWTTSFSGGGISDIATDDFGNIYAVANFPSSFHAAPGSSNPQTIWSQGGVDIAVIKLDGFGNLQWVKSFGGVNDDKVFSVSVSPAGNIYLTGYFTDNISFDFLPVSDPGQQCFLAKLNSSGTAQWVNLVDYRFTEGSKTALDKNEIIHVLCREVYYVNYPSFGSAIARFSANGQLIGSIIDMESDFPYGMAVDKDKNVFLAYGTFATHYAPSFLEKLDSNLSTIWKTNIVQNSPGGNHAYIRMTKGLSLDKAGNAYLSGYANTMGNSGDTMKWYQNNKPPYILPLRGNSDVLAMKIEKDSGNIAWIKNAGGAYTDVAGAMCIDRFDNCYVTGSLNYTTGTSSANGVTYFENLTLTHPDNHPQAFLAKLKVSNEEFSDNVSVYKNEPQLNLEIYPNPSDGIFKIQQKETLKEYTICVYDVMGNCVHTQRNISTLDLSGKVRGVYFVEVRTGTSLYTQKLVLN